MPSYKVLLGPVQGKDGETFQAGESVELEEKAAVELVKLGVLAAPGHEDEEPLQSNEILAHPAHNPPVPGMEEVIEQKPPEPPAKSPTASKAKPSDK